MVQQEINALFCASMCEPYRYIKNHDTSIHVCEEYCSWRLNQYFFFSLSIILLLWLWVGFILILEAVTTNLSEITYYGPNLGLNHTKSKSSFFFLWCGLPSLNPITAYNDRTSDLSFMSLIWLYLVREFWMWLLLLPFRIISRLWNLIFWNPSGATNLFAWFWWKVFKFMKNFLHGANTIHWMNAVNEFFLVFPYIYPVLVLSYIFCCEVFSPSLSMILCRYSSPVSVYSSVL